tara:strand:+ start:99 stop:275 length:177 start_codon:yes stop_codon:yes gene_type:complete
MKNSLDYIFGNVNEDLKDIYTSLQDQIDDTLLANYPALTEENLKDMTDQEKRMLMGWD